MGKKKTVVISKIEQEENYIEYLKKKLNSENYKASVSKEEYDKEKSKYEKAKFKLRVLKNE